MFHGSGGTDITDSRREGRLAYSKADGRRRLLMAACRPQAVGTIVTLPTRCNLSNYQVPRRKPAVHFRYKRSAAENPTDLTYLYTAGRCRSGCPCTPRNTSRANAAA